MSATRPARVLVIGLDSADAERIETWCAEGHLPHLARLRAAGTWARLATTSDVMHVSAWPSMYTGADPGAHGMYHAYQITAGEQEVHRTRADECALEPFWKVLDDAGRETIVLDAFMSAPVPGFGGIQILEYGTWTWFEEPSATPASVGKELHARFGAYPAPEHTKIHGQPEPVRFRQQLLDGAAKKAEVTRWLLREKPWQMLFVTFAEPHPAGHYLWHVQDESYPTHPSRRGQPLPGPELRHAVRDVYAAVDAAIGAILAEVDDDVTVLVTSGDGMGPNFAGCQHVPEVLHRLGLYFDANVGKQQVPEASPTAGARPKRSLASRVRGLVPLELRRAVNRCLPAAVQHRLSMKWANANIDWERTRVFTVPNANEGYLRVNLQGREPRGRVGVGQPYAELLADLDARFRELVNPDNGLKAVRDVVDTDRVFPGPLRPNLPDAVVHWNEEARVLGRLESKACGTIVGRAGHETAPYYTGNHRPTAFLLARGPGIAAGRELSGGSVLDLAPTILSLLDVDPPASMQGRVWSELLHSPPEAPR